MMTPRLLTTASFVQQGSRVVDVGTDHAYIPIWLVQNGICDSALAMDINRGPLMRATENIKKFGMENRIGTRLSDGLEEVCPGEADTVIIAGMGGTLINRILENAAFLYPSVKHYILQPMTAIEETRKFLEQNGFLIADERLAQEEDKLYTVLSVVRGDMKIRKEIYYYIGEKLIENRDALLSLYLDGKIYELDKAISSMEHTTSSEIVDKRNHFLALRDEMNAIREVCASW